MGRWDYEKGELKLPSSEVAKVKAAVRKANNELHETIYEAARAWVRTHGARYRRALAKQSHISPESVDPKLGYEGTDQAVSHLVYQTKGKMPRRDQVTPAKATNKTTEFAVGEEASIVFKGRSVHWYVATNKSAREGARQEPTAVAFFKALNKVNWTRGSGGVFWGNDEYNVDSGRDYAGQGASYITAAYGPLGKKQNHGHESPVIDPRPRYGYAFRGSYGLR